MSRRSWQICASATTLALLVACWLPGDQVPSTPALESDLLQHLLAFVVVGLAWHRAGLHARGVLWLGLALALLTEGGQHLWASGRTAEWRDVAADGTGVLLGIAASAWLLPMWGGRPSP